MTTDRPIEPAEAFALGALHGILLKEAGVDVVYPIEVSTRTFDVQGLVPAEGPLGIRPLIRITIEEVV